MNHSVALVVEKRFMKLLPYLFLMIPVSICLLYSQSEIDPEPKTSSINYWSDGKAEIASYDLMQYRYGELRQGELVQVMVPEDFLIDKQVKNESNKRNHSARVLKRIEIRQFNTGIYQYNMSTSIFTPFDRDRHGKSIKLSASSQEWCGSTYAQFNKKGVNYKSILHSYFEKEADQNTRIKNALLEEEFFTLIRINPEDLPLGNMQLIPSQVVSRFLHLPLRAYSAVVSVGEYSGGDFNGTDLKYLGIEYPELQRNLTIVYKSGAPHIIHGWTDSYPSPFTGEMQSSKAILKTHIKEPYWKLNGVSDAEWRGTLGLDE